MLSNNEVVRYLDGWLPSCSGYCKQPETKTESVWKVTELVSQAIYFNSKQQTTSCYILT